MMICLASNPLAQNIATDNQVHLYAQLELHLAKTKERWGNKDWKATHTNEVSPCIMKIMKFTVGLCPGKIVKCSRSKHCQF